MDDTDIADAVAALHHELARRWPNGLEHIDDIARYALVPAGKMLRPLLLAESARAVGGGGHAVMGAALGVEYLHVATLIHDDIIDSDDLRRGRASVPAAYGIPDAILAGDRLILALFTSLAECRSAGVPAELVLSAIQVLGAAGVDLCRGQALESELVADPQSSVGRYREMAALKTGALCRAACHAGAILGGGSPEWVDALFHFGSHLGLAFQIQDDLLAYTGSVAVTGKPKSSDTQNGRPTLPVLLAYQMGTSTQRWGIEQVLHGFLPEQDGYRLMQEILSETGALQSAHDHAAEEIRLAKHQLTLLPTSESVTILAKIADATVSRDR